MANHNLQLSEKELSARLLRDTTNDPITLTSGVMTVLGGVGAGLFFTSDLFVVLAGLTGASLAACAGYVLSKTVIGKHKAMLKIIEKVRTETIAKRNKVADNVQSNLMKFNEERALKQLHQLHSKFAAFQAVLDHQFDRDELTHKRYLTAAEQLYFGAVDNLNSLSMLCHSTAAIDPKHIQSQLGNRSLAAGSRKAMEQRLEIYNEANTNKENILIVNEQVMTKLDELTIRLGAIQTREGLGEVRLDNAMNEILHLINRTNQYDIRQ
jgi:hypothetical protein